MISEIVLQNRPAPRSDRQRLRRSDRHHVIVDAELGMRDANRNAVLTVAGRELGAEPAMAIELELRAAGGHRRAIDHGAPDPDLAALDVDRVDRRRGCGVVEVDRDPRLLRAAGSVAGLDPEPIAALGQLALA